MLGQRQHPPATALRVVSAPALNSRLKNRYSSTSDMSESSTVAFATTDSMSSVAQHASTRSTPGRRRTSATRPLRATIGTATPCVSRRSRIAARWPRRANAVRIPALQQDADHLHWQLSGDAEYEVERFARDHRIEQPARPGSQIVLNKANHSRRQPGADESPNLRVPRIVHHVEHLAEMARSCSSVPPNGREPPVTDE